MIILDSETRSGKSVTITHRFPNSDSSLLFAGNKCVCNPGYALDASGKVCNPLCDMGCEHADCVSPNNCSCHYGYRKRANNNHICLPHCDAPCHNGTCTAPDVCVCNSG